MATLTLYLQKRKTSKLELVEGHIWSKKSNKGKQSKNKKGREEVQLGESKASGVGHSYGRIALPFAKTIVVGGDEGHRGSVEESLY